MRPFRPDATCPLDGIRVLDLSRLVAGNMVSLQLADFGAEVIKIEDPRKGDPLRAWQTDGVSVHWKVYARNKKSVALNLREPRRPRAAARARRDRAGAHREFPARHAGGDGARPGGAARAQPAPGHRARLGLGPGRALSRPARLRHAWSRACRATRRAPALPTASRCCRRPRSPTWSPGSTARSRCMVALRAGRGERRQGPGHRPAAARSAVLVHRDRGGDLQADRRDRQRTGSRSETTAPRNVFRTKDGRYIGISASIQAMAERLFRAIGRDDMITDPRFRTNTDRVRNAEDCEAPIVEFIARAHAGREHGGLRAPPRSPRRRSTTSTSSSPTRMCRRARSSSSCPTPRWARADAQHHPAPVRHARAAAHARRRALGEHTAEILGALGLDARARRRSPRRDASDAGETS